MASSFDYKDVKRKVGFAAYASTILVLTNLSGCATGPVDKEVDASTPPKTAANEQQTTVRIIQKNNLQVSRGKDQHQLEYEQKQRWYHQQWENNQRVNEQRQRSQLAWQGQVQRSRRANLDYGDYSERLAQAAVDRLHYRVVYNGAYIPIGYPNGDVPSNIGVCTDTVIRSYRRLGVDLQRLVHEDM
ncbi:MAG TPA: DUF1287 domain-containing protein, partial [Thiolinea sp.]|nr:DUF1287 domain-containing protein [Thiolinea sp.]